MAWVVDKLSFPWYSNVEAIGSFTKKEKRFFYEEA